MQIEESPPLSCPELACSELAEPVEGLFVLLQEGLRELWLPVLRQPEFPQHFLSFVALAEEDRGGKGFSVTWCLKRSGW